MVNRLKTKRRNTFTALEKVQSVFGFFMFVKFCNYRMKVIKFQSALRFAFFN